jgi:hypothetical protein
MRVAIVHDYLNQRGGAERVVAALHEIFPEERRLVPSPQVSRTTPTVDQAVAAR